MVVGHGKHLHEQSGRREKGNKVQYINKWKNIALYFLFPPLLEFFPPRTSFFNSALMIDNISSLPPSLPLASNLLAGTTLLRTYHCPHSSLHKPCTRVTSFLSGFLTLADMNNRLSQNIGKKLLQVVA